MVGKKAFNKSKNRPSMQQDKHPAHNMPIPENDGAQLPISPMAQPQPILGGQSPLGGQIPMSELAAAAMQGRPQ